MDFFAAALNSPFEGRCLLFVFLVAVLGFKLGLGVASALFGLRRVRARRGPFFLKVRETLVDFFANAFFNV